MLIDIDDLTKYKIRNRIKMYEEEARGFECNPDSILLYAINYNHALGIRDALNMLGIEEAVLNNDK
jgi:hypothetical protein